MLMLEISVQFMMATNFNQNGQSFYCFTFDVKRTMKIENAVSPNSLRCYTEEFWKIRV